MSIARLEPAVRRLQRACGYMLRCTWEWPTADVFRGAAPALKALSMIRSSAEAARAEVSHCERCLDDSRRLRESPASVLALPRGVPGGCRKRHRSPLGHSPEAPRELFGHSPGAPQQLFAALSKLLGSSSGPPYSEAVRELAEFSRRLPSGSSKAPQRERIRDPSG